MYIKYRNCMLKHELKDLKVEWGSFTLFFSYTFSTVSYCCLENRHTNFKTKVDLRNMLSQVLNFTCCALHHQLQNMAIHPQPIPFALLIWQLLKSNGLLGPFFQGVPTFPSLHPQTLFQSSHELFPPLLSIHPSICLPGFSVMVATNRRTAGMLPSLLTSFLEMLATEKQ